MSNGEDGRVRTGGTAVEVEDPVETMVLIVDDHRSFADLLAAALAAVPGIRCVG